MFGFEGGSSLTSSSAAGLALAAFADEWRIHVHEGQHRRVALIRRLVESGITLPGFGVAKGSEQGIPQRQVAVVVAMESRFAKLLRTVGLEP